MNQIRKWIDLADLDKIFEAKGRLPARIFHGTNPIAAAAILTQNRLQATEPVDDDGLGQVVCVTSRAKVARMFAIEFARANSEFDVGVVFIIDGTKVKADIDSVRHRADTEGNQDEFEYRVKGDIYPLSNYLLGFRLVGKTRLLDSDRFREELWYQYLEEQNYYNWAFHSEQAFWSALDRLVTERIRRS